MSHLTAIAFSGGIDSAVAALRLKAAGVKLFALHFITGFEFAASGVDPLCTVRRLADRIGIDLEIVDGREAFHREVVDYFIEAYRGGRTPNPCVRCNRRIKFGWLLDRALSLGASQLATGHYARLEGDAEGRIHLCKGKDRGKDQSYFLARLTPDQLERVVFPLGCLTKAEVQRLATEKGLETRTGRESQDICFVPGGNYAEFLTGTGGLASRPGPIVDVSGRQLGRHHGLHAFTVGQRRGIDCPGPAPYYVVRLDVAANRLVVGSKADLMSAGCRVNALRWLHPVPSGPLPVSARLRYRSPEQAATVTAESDSRATVRFVDPQAAVTPGQCAVFYQGDEVLGSGWIDSSLDL